jgi:Rod binding domain-containing protein
MKVVAPCERAGVRAQDAPERAKDASRAAEMGREFEAMLLRQLLGTAKLCGAKNENGYGGMATEALADALARAGGIGVAQVIAAGVHEQKTTPAAHVSRETAARGGTASQEP